MIVNYDNNYSSGKVSTECSNSFFAEDVNHARRKLRTNAKSQNMVSNDEREQQMIPCIPCITRTCPSPTHYDIFITTLYEADGYIDDVCVITELKVTQGRQNVFHAIVIFLVASVRFWNHQPKVIRDLLKELDI